MAICAKCGSMNKADGAYCSSCGELLAQAEQPAQKDGQFKKIAWTIVRLSGKGLWQLTKLLLVVVWWLLSQLWRLTRTYLWPALKKLYYRIPRRRTVTAAILGVLAIAIAIPIIVSQLQAKSAAVKTYAMKEPNSSAISILNGDWAQQQAAVREVLGQVGFDIVEGQNNPRDGVRYAIPPEITLLADDASRRANGGRLTLVEFTNLLKDLGFPYKEGEDPAQLMQSGIRNWVITAIEDPSADGAEAALFLQTMALAQQPAIDLTLEDWDPELYRMTLLEMEVFLGAFLQAAEPKTRPKTAFIDRILGLETAYAADTIPACSYAKQWFGQQGKESGVGDLTSINIELIGSLASELTGKAIEKGSEVVGKLMSPLSAAMKLMKLGMLYWAVEVHVEPSVDEIHKPTASEAGKDMAYTAKVGVNEEKYKEYLEGWSASQLAKEIKDCLSFAGLPMPTDTGEIAADVENWSVEWDIVRGGGEHATIGLDKKEFDLKGQFQMKLKRTDKASGEAKLVTDLTTEKPAKHEGFEHYGYVVTRALVETSKPPGLGTLIGGGKAGAGDSDSGGGLDLLGLSDALLDVLSGWFQEVAEPEAHGYTRVYYHTKTYPKYTYEGQISAVHYFNEEETYTSEKNQRGEYTTSYTNTNLSARGNWNVKLVLQYEEPAQGVFTMRPEESAGTVTLSEKMAYRANFYNYCMVGDAPVTTVSTMNNSGGGTSESVWDGILERGKAKNGGFYFQLTGADASTERIMVTHKDSSVTTVSQECFDLVKGTHVDEGDTFEVEIDERVYPNALEFMMESNEEFPEEIQGSSVSKDDYNGETLWRFNLKRIDPDPEG
jgi:hypothetical protein